MVLINKWNLSFAYTAYISFKLYLYRYVYCAQNQFDQLFVNVHAVDLIETPGSRPPPSIILFVAMLNIWITFGKS